MPRETEGKPEGKPAGMQVPAGWHAGHVRRRPHLGAQRREQEQEAQRCLWDAISSENSGLQLMKGGDTRTFMLGLLRGSGIRLGRDPVDILLSTSTKMENHQQMKPGVIQGCRR